MPHLTSTISRGLSFLHCLSPTRSGGGGRALLRALILCYFALSCYCVVLTGSAHGIRWHCANRWAPLPYLREAMATSCSVPLALAMAWTVIPDKQRDRYHTLVDPNYQSVYGASPIGSYRATSFLVAIDLLKERPVLGFGPMSYCEKYGHMPHNLYSQVLSELGIAGALAFIMIVLGVAQNALDARRIVRGLEVTCSFPWHVVIAASYSILLLVIMGWGFNFLYWHVWLWFGGFQICAMYCLKKMAMGPTWPELCSEERHDLDGETVCV